MSPNASSTTSKNENLEFPVVNGAFIFLVTWLLLLPHHYIHLTISDIRLI